jgi:hypothetical protein
MNQKKFLPLALTLSLALAACGGGSGSSTTSGSPASPNGGPNANPNAPVVYTFVTPKVGAQSTYQHVIVANLVDNLQFNQVENIIYVNSDGSFTASWGSSTNTSNYNKVSQQTGSWTGSMNLDCVVSPNGGSEPSPLTQGQTWSITSNEICHQGMNKSTSTSVATGSFIGMETITIAAGTFNAYKFQATYTTTSGTDQPTTLYQTAWRNAAPDDSRVLKVVDNYPQGTGPVIKGSYISETTELQSYH